MEQESLRLDLEEDNIHSLLYYSENIRRGDELVELNWIDASGEDGTVEGDDDGLHINS